MAKTMGIGIQIDSNGDLVIKEELGDVLNYETEVVEQGVVRKTAAYITGKEEVRQAIRIRLQTRKGDDILEPALGMPIKAIIALNDDDFIRAAVQQCVLQDPRVAEVGSIALKRDPETRAIEVSFTAILRDTTELSITEVFRL